MHQFFAHPTDLTARVNLHAYTIGIQVWESTNQQLIRNWQNQKMNLKIALLKHNSMPLSVRCCEELYQQHLIQAGVCWNRAPASTRFVVSCELLVHFIPTNLCWSSTELIIITEFYISTHLHRAYVSLPGWTVGVIPHVFIISKPNNHNI